MSTDYSKMSDFEINELVAKAIGLSHETYPDFLLEPYVWNEDAKDEFNPCNNPADAWPIISDNRISIMYDQSTEKGNNAQWCLASSPCDKHIVDYVSPSKLLRAAMIVFLMMQESKNAI